MANFLEEIKFSAFTILVNLRGKVPTYAHLISTVHSPTDHGCLKEAISRGVEEKKNGERHTEEAMRADACTGVLSTYNKTAGYIDRVNSRIVGALPGIPVDKV